MNGFLQRKFEHGFDIQLGAKKFFLPASGALLPKHVSEKVTKAAIRLRTGLTRAAFFAGLSSVVARGRRRTVFPMLPKLIVLGAVFRRAEDGVGFVNLLHPPRVQFFVFLRM